MTIDAQVYRLLAKAAKDKTAVEIAAAHVESSAKAKRVEEAAKQKARLASAASTNSMALSTGYDTSSSGDLAKHGTGHSPESQSVAPTGRLK